MRRLGCRYQRKDRALLVVTNLVIAIALVAVTAITTRMLTKDEKTSEPVYQPASESIIESNFYPGRIYGEYSDYVFCFDGYLESIGATDVARYIYTTGAGTVFELRFKLDGNKWKLKSTEYRTSDIYTYGMYSGLEVDTGSVIFQVPTENYGTHICDSTSPFKIDWVIFDVFHNATDKNSELAKELRAGVEESNCPFRGLGVDHYEKWPDGTVIWHDDMGDFTVEDGLDLHY